MTITPPDDEDDNDVADYDDDEHRWWCSGLGWCSSSPRGVAVTLITCCTKQSNFTFNHGDHDDDHDDDGPDDHDEDHDDDHDEFDDHSGHFNNLLHATIQVQFQLSRSQWFWKIMMMMESV